MEKHHVVLPRKESPPPANKHADDECIMQSPVSAQAHPSATRSPKAAASYKKKMLKAHLFPEHRHKTQAGATWIEASYKKMLRVGVPGAAVHHRMKLDGADPALMDTILQFPEHRHNVLADKAWIDIHVNQSELMKTYNSRLCSGFIELLDLHRAGRIMVALRAFKELTNAELAEAIDCLEQLHGERVMLLDEILPTDEEADLIRAYTGKSSDLAPCSKWIQHVVSTVPHYQTKVKVMQTMESFTPTATILSDRFRLVERVSDQMMDSAKLKETLSFCLYVGSLLRQADLGNTKHFKVGSLSRVARTVSNDGKMTVMDFMVQSRRSNQDVASRRLQEDFPECHAASRVDMPRLVAKMDRLWNDLEACHAQLRELRVSDLATTEWFNDTPMTTRARNHHGHGIKRLERFLAYSAICYSKLEVERDLALQACRKLSLFCGLETAQTTTACLEVIARFAQDVDSASEKYWARVQERRMKHDVVVSAQEQPTTSSAAIDESHINDVASLVNLYTSIIDQSTQDQKGKTEQKNTATKTSHATSPSEPAVDVSHIHDVASLVVLYTKLVAAPATHVSNDHDPKEPTLTATKEQVEVASASSKGKAKAADESQHLHHVRSLVALYKELKPQFEEKPKHKKDDVMATFKARDEALRCDEEVAQFQPDHRIDNASVVEEHIHHVASLVDLHKGLQGKMMKKE